MSEAPAPGTPSSYYGRPARRLDNGHCWVEVLAQGGPRIVGFGLAGHANVLAETPEIGWDAGPGVFELLGGHRLWFAPESPECSFPDAAGATVTALPATADGAVGVRIVGAFEPATGLRREMQVRLAAGSAGLAVRHVLSNEGARTFDVSLWPITQLKLGGIATVELPEPDPTHSMKPTQLIALWPYSSWADKRLKIGERAATVTAVSEMPFKIGFLNHDGSASYVRDGIRFIKRFDPATDAPHADMGCNLEIYTDQGTIELESLGPLVRLGPGESATHDEQWELARIGE